MTPAVPFLWFSERAEEAARLCCSVFPGSRVERVVTLPSDSPSGPPGAVIAVEFVLRGRFGVARQLTPHRLLKMMADPGRRRARQATDAMMTIVSLDIAALQAAFDRDRALPRARVPSGSRPAAGRRARSRCRP